MYAVIFRAIISGLDEQYCQVAHRMRKLALEKYGCIEFTSVAESDEEISISYRQGQEQIKSWKNGGEHLAAQDWGKSKWYGWYKVQIAEVVREYGSNA